jgi:hypothetical protein
LLHQPKRRTMDIATIGIIQSSNNRQISSHGSARFLCTLFRRVQTQTLQTRPAIARVRLPRELPLPSWVLYFKCESNCARNILKQLRKKSRHNTHTAMTFRIGAWKMPLAKCHTIPKSDHFSLLRAQIVLTPDCNLCVQ